MSDRISDETIAAYIEKVVASRVLGKSERRLKLLTYLITEEASGRGDALKAYSIGLDVLEKPEDFDPSADSSVRVEMGRLRSALAVFEGGEFADTELTVDVPVGTYRPVLTARTDDVPTAPAQPVKNTRPIRGRKLRWLAAMAACIIFAAGLFFGDAITSMFRSDDTTIEIELREFAGDAAIATQIGSALRRGLVRNKYVRVLSSDGQEVDADFVVRGRVNLAGGTRYRVNAELINGATDQVVWTKSIFVDGALDIEDRIAVGLGNELRVRLFGATKAVLEGRDPQTLTPDQLFVMATWVPGPATNAIDWELERVALMRLALAKNPDFGAAHSVMADKLAYLANVYAPSNTREAREEAERHAQRALELSPQNADVVFNVAQSQWHLGLIGASEVSMRRVLELDPGHDLARFLALVIPYSCAVPPDDVLEQAIAFDNDLGPANPIRWLTLTWIAWLHAHQGDYELALDAERRASVIFEIPYTFMRHAMLLNKLGEPELAADIIRRQQINWPDISPDHFASVTVPRLCREAPMERRFIENYEALATAMKTRL